MVQKGPGSGETHTALIINHRRDFLSVGYYFVAASDWGLADEKSHHNLVLG